MNSMNPSIQYTQIMRINEPFVPVSPTPTMFLTTFLSLMEWWNVIFITSLYIYTVIQVFHSFKDHYHYYGTDYDLRKMRQRNKRIPRYIRTDKIHTDDIRGDRIHTDASSL